MLNEVFKPKRPPVAGGRKLGDLSDRQAMTNAASNQSQFGGSRYDTKAVKSVAEADTKVALAKAKQMKSGKTATGQPAAPVEIDPVKNIVGQGFN